MTHRPVPSDAATADDPATGSRRRVLRDAACVGVGALAAWTGTSTAHRAAAGERRADPARIVARQAGPFEVLALLDAHGPFPGRRQDQFPDARQEDWARAERLDPDAFGPDDTWELDFRCYAVRRPGGRATLVDTGVGPAGSPASAWAPVPGHLPAVLELAGIDRDDVDSVILTHLHEDHFGWAVDAAGRPMFPNARHVVQRAETAALDEDDSATAYVVEPLRRAGLLHEIDGRVRVLGGGRGGELTAVPTPGHTAGHQSVLVDGGHRRIVITGDVLVHAVQLAAPPVAYRLESDPAAARRSRQSLLAEARRHRALLATSHLNRPFLRT
ncbi:MBL fold metallo-hydrolase [Streptomyces sp. MP131-18]|uniref:MBL fold metallo-hydrolase n=1 Tax=Streptomyces sp. MP131-18 TaxID=1857892 RepID=UPI0009A18964|nr:MBL fold metallo-hydrolase [Streptomyces sp. MP131-18]ONK11238.1 N-acyl homoserine lactonase AttM [Streptomyces sp. MP131-18]